MTDFSFWFTEGLWHIADPKAYDHILFLLVLFCGFKISDWKKVLLLITAFTIGHCITLALSVTDILKAKTSVVEFLIPCTIMFTALYNIIQLKNGGSKNLVLNFLLALFFGLIHGLGFSVLLKSLLGRTNDIPVPLLSFNLGLEVGQILIIACITIVTLILTQFIGLTDKTWRFFISAASFGVAFIMAVERF